MIINKELSFVIIARKGRLYLKKARNKIIIITLLIITITFVAFGIYISDYYKAEPTVVEMMYEGQNINVIDDGNMIIFKPKESNSDTGFVFYPGGKVEHLAYIPLMQKIAERGN